jgi:release factor glutamine methyltransferase
LSNDPRGVADVYPASEDTATLARVLRAYRGEVCLEIGFGSGAVLDSLLPRFGLVVGTDVLSVAQAVAAKGEAEVIVADRATCFRDETFDLVAFNPPYLPSDGIADRAVDGGEGGIEVPLAFLNESLRVVRRDGVIVVLLSDEGDIDGFRTFCERKGLTFQEKGKTNLFFENLFVFELRRD